MRLEDKLWLAIGLLITHSALGFAVLLWATERQPPWAAVTAGISIGSIGVLMIRQVLRFVAREHVAGPEAY
jgi:hypothetical protein